MKFRLKRLNQQGFDHILVLVVFIVLFGAVGSYLLVESHAATSPYSYYYSTNTNNKYCLMNIGAQAVLSTCSANATEARVTKTLINGGSNFTVKINNQCLQYQTSGLAVFASCSGYTDQWWNIYSGSIEPFSTPNSNFCMGATGIGRQIGKQSCSSTGYIHWTLAAAPATTSPTPGPAPVAAATKPCVYYEFYNSEPNTYGNACVKDLQLMLHNIGSSSKYHYQGFSNSGIYPTDGIYGSGTVTQVTDFQKYLGITHDGVVGEVTWADLCHYDSAASNGSVSGVYASAGCKTGPFGSNRYP